MEMISCGVIKTLTQNVIYALPVKRALLFSPTAGASFDISNDDAMATHIGPITLVEGKYEVSGGFIRSTAADASVILKAF